MEQKGYELIGWSWFLTSTHDLDIGIPGSYYEKAISRMDGSDFFQFINLKAVNSSVGENEYIYISVLSLTTLYIADFIISGHKIWHIAEDFQFCYFVLLHSECRPSEHCTSMAFCYDFPKGSFMDINRFEIWRPYSEWPFLSVFVGCLTFRQMPCSPAICMKPKMPCRPTAVV